MRRRGSAGFTLIELLIVVAIIALLAAIAIPVLLNSIHRSRSNAPARHAQDPAIIVVDEDLEDAGL